MAKKDIRRHHRVSYLGRVVISWVDPHGQPKYAPAKCLDVSEAGMRIETPEAIPVRTNVSLRAEQIDLAGSATVKHVEGRGSKCILGLELSQALRDRTLKVIRDAEASGKLVSVS
jgi:PilZ domain